MYRGFAGEGEGAREILTPVLSCERVVFVSVWTFSKMGTYCSLGRQLLQVGCASCACHPVSCLAAGAPVRCLNPPPLSKFVEIRIVEANTARVALDTNKKVLVWHWL